MIDVVLCEQARSPIVAFLAIVGAVYSLIGLYLLGRIAVSLWLQEHAEDGE